MLSIRTTSKLIGQTATIFEPYTRDCFALPSGPRQQAQDSADARDSKSNEQEEPAKHSACASLSVRYNDITRIGS